LATGLGCQLIAPKAFFKPELHKNAKPHFLSVQFAVTGRQLR
jgi:hypothetical protein